LLGLLVSGCIHVGNQTGGEKQKQGPLQVAEESKHLEYPDGSPFLWLGDTLWGMTEYLERRDVDLYLDDRKKKGINVVQFCLFWGKREEDPVRFTTNPTNAYGHKAFREVNGKPDPLQPWIVPGGSPTEPNDYWDHVDYCLEALAKRGMYAAMLPFWGRRYVNATHPGHSMQVFNNENIYQYGEFLGVRYGKMSHIIWVNGGDVQATSGGNYPALYRKFAEGLAYGISGIKVRWFQKDPAWNRFIMTYHPDGTPMTNSSTWFHNDPWLDFNMIETHVSRNYVAASIRQDLALQPTKPTVLGEGHYEGITRDKKAEAIHIRRQAYQSYFAGAAGHTYGAASDESKNGPLFSPSNNWRRLLDLEGATQLEWVKALLESHDWQAWKPAPELIVAGRGEGEFEKLAVKASGKALIYFPDNSPATLDPAKISSAQWFDPRNGSYSRERNLNSTSFSPPNGFADAVLILETITEPSTDKNSLRIRPYAGNPHYWQYQGKPVLLLGGSKDDNLFQVTGLEEHLDLLASVGGNVIRNTMSDRKDTGNEVYAFRQLESGKYDLDQWNEEYWRRFETLLSLCQQRDVIVQIEVWDRFDYSDIRDMGNWIRSPWNPANNLNYTSEETGLATTYAKHHPSRDMQPFFHSIPTMEKYDPRLDIIRFYQEKVVARMLSISLKYPNVLYCMNNETSTAPEWGQHWIAFIKRLAREKGVDVFCTDMFDDFHRGAESAKLLIVESNPQIYDFIDVSQVNSRTFNEDHWNNVYWFNEKLRHLNRPLNNTKIYSDGETSFGSGTPVDGVERFWRNLIAGCASCRFHRPTAGIGLNEISQACIRAARLAESRIQFWNTQPRQDLLADRQSDEAYLSAKPGESYLLYFTDGGSVRLDLSDQPGKYVLEWVEIASGEMKGEPSIIEGGRPARITAPGNGGWVALINR
ncbi:MAG: DUF4038 domain-containing protein, partial [Verrucomicrobiae bacterium]|nr:DUF4038 domain-containing protein [Verrucomicrobiae bacterium]